MSSPRDDMVFVTDLGPQVKPTAMTRAREDRRLAREKKGGILRRLAQIRIARRLRVRSRRARSARRRIAARRSGVGGLASKAGRAPFLSSIGAIVAGVAVAGAVVLRLATGEPLESLGAQINRMLLGDLDEESRAKMATRRQLTGDQDLVRIVGQEGRINAQILSVAADLQRLNKQREIGITLLREKFPVNTTLDMLIMRAAEVFRREWVSNGGEDATKRFRENYGESINKVLGEGGGR